MVQQWFKDSSMVVQYGSRLYKMLKNLSKEGGLDLRQNSRVMGRGVVVMKQPRLYKMSSFFQFPYEYPSIEDVV